MEIYIEDQCLGGISINESTLVKRFGIKNGKSINRRLCALGSAPSIGDVPVDPPDGLKLRETDSNLEFVVGNINNGLVCFQPIDKVMPTSLHLEQLMTFKQIRVTKIEGGL